MYRHLQQLLLCSIFIIFFLYGCENDENNLTEKTHNLKQTSTKVSFNDLINDSRFVNAVSKLKGGKKITGSEVASRSAMEDQYGFTIADKPIVVIQNGDITSYTMLIHRDTQEPGVYENLVLQVDGADQAKAITIRYSNTGDKTVALLDLDEIVNSRTMQIVCIQTNIYPCCCPNHTEHRPGITKECGVLPTSTTTECTTIYSDSNDNNGGGGFIGGDTGSGGGGGGSTPPINPPPTDCGHCDPDPDPPFYTEPVEDVQNDPCDELKKLMDSQIDWAISQNASEITSDEEHGYNFTKSAQGNYDWEEISTIGADGKIIIKAGLNYIGGIHAHQENAAGGYGMFSWHDLHVLFTSYRYASFQNKSAVTFMLSSTEGQFALKITNWQGFRAEVFKVIGNTADPALVERKLQNKEDELKDLYTDSDNLERTFLQYLSATNLSSVSLYKIDGTKFVKRTLAINNPGNSPVISTPCN